MGEKRTRRPVPRHALPAIWRDRRRSPTVKADLKRFRCRCPGRTRKDRIRDLPRTADSCSTTRPATSAPLPLWWWSGAKVTRERLAWQLRGFADGGVHNLVVINLAPAGPTFGARTDDPAWFGEEWWAPLHRRLRIAAELGTRLWFYDQIGFSGANVQGGVTRRHPRRPAARCAVTTDRRPGARSPCRAAETPLAAYDLAGRRLSGPGRNPGTARVEAGDGTEVRLVATVPTAFDYLDPHAVGLLLDAVHHEYDRRVPSTWATSSRAASRTSCPARTPGATASPRSSAPGAATTCSTTCRPCSATSDHRAARRDPRRLLRGPRRTHRGGPVQAARRLARASAAC